MVGAHPASVLGLALVLSACLSPSSDSPAGIPAARHLADAERAAKAWSPKAQLVGVHGEPGADGRALQWEYAFRSEEHPAALITVDAWPSSGARVVTTTENASTYDHWFSWPFDPTPPLRGPWIDAVHAIAAASTGDEGFRRVLRDPGAVIDATLVQAADWGCRNPFWRSIDTPVWDLAPWSAQTSKGADHAYVDATTGGVLAPPPPPKPLGVVRTTNATLSIATPDAAGGFQMALTCHERILWTLVLPDAPNGHVAYDVGDGTTRQHATTFFGAPVVGARVEAVGNYVGRPWTASLHLVDGLAGNFTMQWGVGRAYVPGWEAAGPAETRHAPAP